MASIRQGAGAQIPFPLLLFLLPSPPLEVANPPPPPQNPAIWCILALKSDIWWQQFLKTFLRMK